MSALLSRAQSMWDKLTGSAGRGPFPGSPAYWEQRYRAGGTSGEGSYGRLAEFKAQTLNALVAEFGIASVVEFGCGDGHQLLHAKYPRYVGLDVSPAAIVMSSKRFPDDPTKSFFLFDPFCFVDNHHVFRSDAALSLDVIYHLVEDAIFEAYMAAVFRSAGRYAIVYSTDHHEHHAAHVRHRRFTDWVARNCPQWKLVRRIPNAYPPHLADGQPTSAADFFVFAVTT